MSVHLIESPHLGIRVSVERHVRQSQIEEPPHSLPRIGGVLGRDVLENDAGDEERETGTPSHETPELVLPWERKCTVVGGLGFRWRRRRVKTFVLGET